MVTRLMPRSDAKTNTRTPSLPTALLQATREPDEVGELGAAVAEDLAP